MLTLGLDIGTTTISIVVMDKEKQKVVEAGNVFNDSFIPTEHEWEKMQDPDRILKNAKTLLDDCLMRYPQISSIGLTGQMHGIVYLDENGKAVSPLYTWQYGGGRELLTEMGDDHVHVGYGMVTYYYHHRQGMVPKSAVTFCTIMDYLGMHLTGRKRPLMHISNAASLGMFDCETHRFREERIRGLGLDLSMIPEVSTKFEQIGVYHKVPVKIAIGDNQASFLGTVGMENGAVLVNMGTGGQISMLIDQFLEIPGIETRPLSEKQYLLIGASLCGGRAYAVLEHFFRAYAEMIGAESEPQYEVMEQLAQMGRERERKARRTEIQGNVMGEHPAEGGMQVVTTFSGTRQEPSKRGSITGISESNFTPEFLTYGVLKGMAEELYAMYERMLEAGCHQAENFTASGNGLRKNPVLREIFSEMFGAELIMAKFEEEAACGAALI